MLRSKTFGVTFLTVLVMAVTDGAALSQTADASNLSVTKVADNEIGVVGDDVTYTIIVENDGPDVANDVVVRDLLPVHLDLVEISATGAGGCILLPLPRCTFPALGVGSSETVTVVATPLAAVPIVNEAVVKSDSTDIDTSDNRASFTVFTAKQACTDVGTQGSDRLRGTGGDDVLCGMGGRDRLIGRGGDDRLFGGSGNDRALAGGGRDRLIGERGRDILRGGPNRDVLRGGPRVDLVFGGGGRDRCVAASKDRVRGC